MDGFVFSFIRRVYSKSEDAEEMSRYHSPPSHLATYAKANQADMDKIAPLCRKHERSLPQRVARVRKAWRAQFNSFDNQLKAPKGLLYRLRNSLNIHESDLSGF